MNRHLSRAARALALALLLLVPTIASAAPPTQAGETRLSQLVSSLGAWLDAWLDSAPFARLWPAEKAQRLSRQTASPSPPAGEAPTLAPVGVDAVRSTGQEADTSPHLDPNG